MATKSASAPAASEGSTALAPEQVDALRQVAKRANGEAAAIRAAIAAWWVEHIHNSPVAQVTDAYNHFHSRLPALEADILAAIKKEI